MDDLVHQVFSRQGGVSQGDFASLNVGNNTRDSGDAVLENRRRIQNHLGVSRSFYVQQVHGREILVLKSRDLPLEKLQGFVTHVHTADGIITDIKDLALMIQVADCQAVLFYDPVRQVIANVHSGWRGSVQNIIGHCVDVMKYEFGCSPADILVGISPSLGPCCAEFIHYKKELPKSFWPYKAADKDTFDFWGISQGQLQEKGISEKNIEVMG
ncbi:MAG: multicopper polyphenol oxidase, partial [Desulfobacterales bacterium]